MNGCDPAAYEQARVDVLNALPGKLTGYDCPICKNKGAVYVLREMEIVSRPCECLTVRQVNAMLEKSGVSEALKQKTLGNFIAKKGWQQTILEKANAFIEDDSALGFALLGQVGCGKTHICIGIVNALLAKGIPAMYMPYREEISVLKKTQLDESFGERMDWLKRVKYLYIDDLFKGKINDSDISLMFEIINDRYLNNRPILVSCEKNIDELREIDEAIASRIYEMCGKYRINIARDDMKNQRMKS